MNPSRLPVLRVNGITVHLGFEASQVIQTAYTKDHTVFNSKHSSSIAEVILPPHTSIMVRKTANGAVTTLKYDCPVMVQFDVAVEKLTNTIYIEGHVSGVVYAKYLIPEKFYTYGNGTVITNNSIEQTVLIVFGQNMKVWYLIIWKCM